MKILNLKNISKVVIKTFGPSNRQTGKPANRQTGQALVELAIFGAIFILILGSLLSYGLRYNFQQQVSMTAFRRALKIASDPERGSGAYMMITEKHIPNPSDMYGIGDKTAITASASVTRNYAMHEQATDAGSLSGVVMDSQTQRDNDSEKWMRRIYKMAGFRIEYKVPTNVTGKYKLVYGSILAKKGAESDPITGNPSTWTWVAVSSGDAQRVCESSHLENVYDGEGNVLFVITVCDKKGFAALRIIDSCIGETINYDSCYEQSRMLVDVEYCTQECERKKVPGDDMNCAATCGMETLAPNQNDPNYNEANGGAWYAAGYTYTNCTPDHRCYTFPILKDKLFAFAGGYPEQKGMGMQQDSTAENSRSEYFKRNETSFDITTNEKVAWQSVDHKKVIRQDNLCTKNDTRPECAGDPAMEGYEIPHSQPEDFVNVQTDNLDTSMSVTINEDWQTAK